MIGSNTMNFISIKSMKITVVGHYKDVFAVSILEVRYSFIITNESYFKIEGSGTDCKKVVRTSL